VVRRAATLDAPAVAAARSDRDEAIGLLKLVLDTLAPGDPDRSIVAARLGRLHGDRYNDGWEPAAPPDSGDLDIAVNLLSQAVDDDAGEETMACLV
jgi:hypothetical protein